MENFTHEMKAYDVNITKDYDAVLSLWNVTLTMADGSVLVNPSLGHHPGVVSILVEGDAYVSLSEGCSTAYSVYSQTGTSFFNGESSPSTTSYTLTLTSDVTLYFIYYQQEDGGCFSWNTMVKMSDGTEKRISDISSGDVIKAYDPKTETIVDSEVSFSSGEVKRTASSYDKYTFSNGTVIEIIDRDRLYNVEDNKMKWMDQWYIGEHGLTYDGEEVSLVSHEVVNEPITYYYFDCQYYNYFLNGMLAGHKKAKYPFFHSKFIEESKN